jgi:hypothetical protein
MEWRDTSLLRSTTFVEDTIPALNETANSTTNTPEDRGRAIFTLFGRYLQPDCSSSEFHQVFTDVGWLQKARLYPLGGYTGWVPIEESSPSEDAVFVLDLFPAESDARAQRWEIYFRLTNRWKNDQWDYDALRFLQGSESAESVSKMAEFALCFPHSIYHPNRSLGRIERFSTFGVHVYEEMGR